MKITKLLFAFFLMGSLAFFACGETTTETSDEAEEMEMKDTETIEDEEVDYDTEDAPELDEDMEYEGEDDGDETEE